MTESTLATVRVESIAHGDGDDALTLIRLCRPAKLNALDLAMLTALEDALARVEESAARAVIVTGDGNHFCAGGDIDAWSKLSPQDFAHQWIRRGHRVFDRLAQLRPVTIAAVNGAAMGAIRRAGGAAAGVGRRCFRRGGRVGAWLG